jgi:hypothetical protein
VACRTGSRVIRRSAASRRLTALGMPGSSMTARNDRAITWRENGSVATAPKNRGAGSSWLTRVVVASLIAPWRRRRRSAVDSRRRWPGSQAWTE